MGMASTHLAISLIEKRLKAAFKTGLQFETTARPKTSTLRTTSPGAASISSNGELYRSWPRSLSQVSRRVPGNP